MALFRHIRLSTIKTSPTAVLSAWRPIALISSLALMAACQPTQPQFPASKPTPISDPDALVINIDLTSSKEQQVAPQEAPQPASDEPSPQPTDDTQRAQSTAATEAQQQAQQAAARQQLLERQMQLLELAEDMHDKGYYDLSLSLLDDIIMDVLEPVALSHYLELMAASHLHTGNSYAALAWLHKAQTLAPPQDQASHLHRLQLLQQAYTANEQYLEAAINAIDISINQTEALSRAQQQHANDDIWDLLLQVPSMQLQATTQRPLHPVTKGWLALALSTDKLHTLAQQQAAITHWQSQNPLHPASQLPPTSLAKLADLKSNQAKKIALVLPTSGPLGKLGQAIIDGFMASYYQTLDQCGTQCQNIPQLIFVNSHQIDNWTESYQQLNQQGVELVIGPLDKHHVGTLQSMDLPIPTMALNYVTDTPNGNQVSGQPLYQFGLSIEAEARQLAQQGRQQGHKNALVIYAQTPWAKRANQAFQQHWQSLGGKVSDAISFHGDGDHARSISAGLHIDASKQRRKAMQKLLAKNVKFEPRRRQDVDLVIMLALPEDARQLVPTLAFHHAADIPVYASHHAYQGPTDSTRDRDLNKVYFSDLPWMLEADPTAQSVQQVWPTRQRYNRLFALGADAHRLFPRLQQMEMFPATRVRGLTGLLRLEDQAIMAKLSWARFHKGQPKLQQGAHELE